MNAVCELPRFPGKAGLSEYGFLQFMFAWSIRIEYTSATLKPPLQFAKSTLFGGDGTMLAYPRGLSVVDSLGPRIVNIKVDGRVDGGLFAQPGPLGA